MKRFIRSCTNAVSTKKGMTITLIVWLLLAVLLVFAPGSKDYEITNMQILPDEAESMVAKQKIEDYFPGDEHVTALLVFHNPQGDMDLTQVATILDRIEEEKITGIESIPPFSQLPPPAQESFLSDNKSTALVPVSLDSNLENKEIQSIVKEFIQIGGEDTNTLQFRVTGPAGIAADTLELFSRADVVLMMGTVLLILVLLIVIYRSPLLALIPLLASGLVFVIVDKVLGLLGKAGMTINNETLSIMMILLFAAVTDYSLFVFSRYREELKQVENRFEAMKRALHEVGLPVFFSGGTVLIAMLVLFFTEYRVYQNFAPIFAVTMAIIMIASITFIPALFSLFGRKAFWPKVPKVGDEIIRPKSFWSQVGKFVTRKPIVSLVSVLIILLLSSGNLFNMKYEFDTIKTFPEDMASREGYEIVESNFEKGSLAPTTVLLESGTGLTDEQTEDIRVALGKQAHVSSVSLVNMTNSKLAATYELVFDTNPYSEEAMDVIDTMLTDRDNILSDKGIEGNLYFSGVTAQLHDENSYSNRDVIIIVILESLFILVMLIALTRSIRLPIYMVGTILFSFAAALGLGTFLIDLLFGYEAISIRVPLYAFVFLVALGVDYNIILISRFIEERKKNPVKKAMEISVAHTGGVISSAGLILAGTFAVLMTQPISVLFVFGFIVALGILIDTFLIRGVLLPALVVLLEKNRKPEVEIKHG